ncbi:MAG TPA: hypothetical protein VGG06_15665 [Thermoanaerobaculia bacterium]
MSDVSDYFSLLASASSLPEISLRRSSARRITSWGPVTDLDRRW